MLLLRLGCDMNVSVSCLCLATMMPLCLCSHWSQCVFVRHLWGMICICIGLCYIIVLIEYLMIDLFVLTFLFLVCTTSAVKRCNSDSQIVTYLQRWARFNMILLLHWPFGCHSALLPDGCCWVQRFWVLDDKVCFSSRQTHTEMIWWLKPDCEQKHLQYRDGFSLVTIHGSLAEVLF